VTVDTVILDKFQAAYVSKITVELTTFLPCSLKNKTECNGGYCSGFTTFDVKRSCSILVGYKTQSRCGLIDVLAAVTAILIA